MNRNFIETFPLENKYRYIIKKIKYNVDLKELFNSRYIGKKIKKDIKNTYNSYYCELLDNSNYNFIINIDKNKILNNNEILDKLINWVFYIKQLFRYNKINIINLFLTKYKKEFPNYWKILDENEINSGMSVYRVNIENNKPIDTGIIYIWRNEELKKVLTHELIHSFHIDYKIKKIYNNKISINESFVEFITCFIKTINNSKDYKDFRIKYIEELKYQKYKMKDIINYYKKYNKTFDQKTHIYEYYFIKSYMWNNLDEGLKILEKIINREDNDIDNLDINTEDINKYYNNSFKKYIENNIDNRSKIIYTDKMRKSLRMCYYD
jgi:hypothetical protein